MRSGHRCEVSRVLAQLDSAVVHGRRLSFVRICRVDTRCSQEARHGTNSHVVHRAWDAVSQNHQASSSVRDSPLNPHSSQISMVIRHDVIGPQPNPLWEFGERLEGRSQAPTASTGILVPALIHKPDFLSHQQWRVDYPAPAGMKFDVGWQRGPRMSRVLYHRKVLFPDSFPCTAAFARV